MTKAKATTVKDAVHKLQLCLLDGIQDESKLIAAGSLMSRSDYQDVVTERTIANMCGYPLCSNFLPSDRPHKGRYRISLKEHKVYDLQEAYMYCSAKCVMNSRSFASGLPEERSSSLNPSKLNEVLQAFEQTGLDLGKKGDFGISELKIQEKVEVKGGEVSLEEWIGPSNAIEGYVPHSDRTLKPQVKPPKRGSKSQHGQVDEKKSVLFSEADFTSVIITDNEYSISKLPSTSTSLLNKHTTEPRGKESQRNQDDEIAELEKQVGCLQIHDINEQEQPVKRDARIFKIEKGIITHSSSRNSLNEAGSKTTTLKSSLKSSYTKKETHSVTWADEETDLDSKSVSENQDSTSMKMDDDSYCFESREAPQELATKPELVPNYNLFESKDSLYDDPPEGFELSLSPFSTMFMALFAWVSSSSLAFIYGRDETDHEEYSNINGQEYPRKIVVSDGRSNEIRQTLAGCLARTLPAVVADLKIRIPISTLEKEMGKLIDTMSFVDPLPPFRMKQWQLIVILFLDALSVFRIPGLTSFMSEMRFLLPKVQEAAGVSGEEFKILRDLIIPLGRVPGNGIK